jgi:hypothetical protein
MADLKSEIADLVQQIELDQTEQINAVRVHSDLNQQYDRKLRSGSLLQREIQGLKNQLEDKEREKRH